MYRFIYRNLHSTALISERNIKQQAERPSSKMEIIGYGRLIMKVRRRFVNFDVEQLMATASPVVVAVWEARPND